MKRHISRPVRFAIIGAGMAAKPHFAALAELRRVGELDVVSVFTRDAERRRAAARALDAAPAGSIAAIAADPSVDAVLLLTPPDARAEIVGTLAAAGKALLMEKPVERSHAAAVRLVEVMEAANQPLGIVLQHRLRPASRRMADLVANRELGAPALVRLDVPWWRDQDYYDEEGRGTFARDGGGVLMTQAIHALDLMLSILGPVAQVQALAATTRLHRMEAEDFATAGLVFANGAVGSVSATTASYPGAGETLSITFDHGAATLAGGRLDVTWRNGRTETVGASDGTGGSADPMAFDHTAHRAVLSDFAAALVEDRPPAITGRSALAVHALIEAIRASSQRGARIELSV